MGGLRLCGHPGEIYSFKSPPSTLFASCQRFSSYFICSFPELDKAVSISTSRTRQFPKLIFPLGRWCRLSSRLDFADQTFKYRVNILQVDIVVKIWEQYDGNNVSSPQLPSCLSVQRNQHLPSDRFKITMSHVVKDLALSASLVSLRWVSDK